MNGFLQQYDIHRLQQILIDIQTQRFLGIGKFIVGADNDRFRLLHGMIQLLQGFDPAHKRHLNVQYDDIRQKFPKLLQGFPAVVSMFDFRNP
ncbi:hypothetical protein D3C77_307720 [compost metagenome]